jgi:tRNA nucleotidyltransferase (CCA-adding enzyme)
MSPALPLPDPSRVPGPVLGVLRTLQQAGYQAFLAGGAVRDLLRLALGEGAEPQDFDVATDALPEVVAKLFAKVIPTGLQHGTVTVLAGPDKIEVTTFRGEGPYLDGRRPSSVTFLGSIEGDLARRDFTVNAIAWDPLAPGATGLRDPFDGCGDLQRRRLRAVGEARARFSEDGLRPLRAVRFACTLRLALEHTTGAAIRDSLETFDRVARERVRDELQKLLLRGAPASRGLRLLRRTGLLERIAPELAALGPAALRAAGRRLDASPRTFPARLWALLEGTNARQAAALLERLKLPRKEAERVLLLLREAPLPYDATWPDGACRRVVARIGRAALEEWLAVRRARLWSEGPPSAQALAQEEALAERLALLLASSPPLSIGDLALDGRGIMSRLHLQPGPQLGALLAGLLERVFDDPSLNTAGDLERLSSEWLAAHSTGNPQA